jgi:hypothetical protein
MRAEKRQTYTAEFTDPTGFPLPYLLLYYFAPGFQAMRVPARFGFMALLAACVLAALGVLRVF